jgi:hypothetical protein
VGWAAAALLEGNRAVGLLQHHDALPGTMTAALQMDSKDCLYSADCKCRDASCMVLEDYLHRLANASAGLRNLTARATAAIVAGGATPADVAAEGARDADADDAAGAERRGANRTWVAVSNPLGHDRAELVSVFAAELPAAWRTNLSALTVRDAAGK